MAAVEVQTEGQRVTNALALIVSSRDPLMQQFGRYLRASASLEAWLASGAPMDPESAQAITKDVSAALEALTVLGTACHSVAGVAGRAAGVQPDTSEAN